MADDTRRRMLAARTHAPARGEAPLWRQALEGIGMVVVLAATVAAAGLLTALLVSLLF